MATLAEVVKGIGKKFSKNNPDIIFDPRRKVDWISSGNIVYDLVSGGGFPRRRISEIFGLEHSGKTALSLCGAGLAQKAGLHTVFLDFEQCWFAAYAERNYGLVQDNDTFTVFQPDCIEEGDAIIDELTKVDKLDLLICDSIDAMRPKALIERSQTDDPRIPGSHAWAMTQLIHKLVPWLRKKNCACVLLNQMRTAINTYKYEQAVGTAAGYNPKESFTTTGGHAARFYASIRVKMEFCERINDEAAPDLVMGGAATKVRKGHSTKIIDVKNKVHTPFLKGESHFIYPTEAEPGGWDRGSDILELLKRRGKVRQASSRFTYNGLNIPEWVNIGSEASSREKFCAHPKLLEDAEDLLKSIVGRYPAEVLDLAIPGEDYSEEDIKTDFKPTPIEIQLLDEDPPPSPVEETSFE